LRTLVTSYPDYLDLRNRSRSFEGLVAFTSVPVGFAVNSDTPSQLRFGMVATANLFPLMSVQPALGRAFRPEEDEVPGRDAVIVLGYDFWKQQFGGDSSVLGKIVRLNNVDFTVIGVAPERFTGLEQYTRFEFFVPLMMWPRLIAEPGVSPLEARDFRRLTVKGRLRAGVSLEQAQAELSIISADLQRGYPATNQRHTITARTELQVRIAQAPPSARLIAMLFTLGLAVLVVTCANVAGLLVSRATARARELAMRQAIGAGRARLIRQLMTESMLIASIGSVLALAVGYAGVSLFRQWRFPTDVPIAPSFELDVRAFGFSLLVAFISALLFGVAPAIQATRPDLTAVMKATDAAGFGRRRGWGRAVLVAGQVAVSVVLVVVAAFMYRGFQQQVTDGPGYRTTGLLTMSFDPGLVGYSDAQAQRFYEQLTAGARVAPGVRTAALASFVPINGYSPTNIVPEGFQFPPGRTSVAVPMAIVDEQFFETMGMPVVSGRVFSTTDSAGAARVAIVNERLAENYWPGQDALGKRLRLNGGDGPWVEIVGVSRTTKYTSLGESPRDFLYLPYRQHPQRRMVLVAQSTGESASILSPLIEVVRGLDASQPIFNVRTMEELYAMRATRVLYIIIALVSAMGVMGLGLAIAGLYGLVAYTVSRRTREIGIRIAVGANRAMVMRMVVRQGMRLAVAGLAIGLLASVAARRGLRLLFPGGPARDGQSELVMFLLVASMVLIVTLLAVYVPARRASRLNPVETLRHD
jgi:predicted permease